MPLPEFDEPISRAQREFADLYTDPTGVFLRYSDVFGQTATLPMVEDFLRRAPLLSWLLLVARLDHCLTWRAFDPDLQLRIASRLFPPADADDVDRLLRREREFGRPLFVHGHQLRYLLRLALITPGVPAMPEDGAFPSDLSLGRVLLAVSEVLADPKSGPPEIVLPPDLDAERLTEYWLRAANVQSQVFDPETANIYWTLHVEGPRRWARAYEPEFQADTVLRLGLPLEEFVALGYAMLSGSLSGDPLTEEYRLAANEPLSWLRDTRVPEARREAFVARLSSTPADLAERARAITGDVRRIYDYSWLEDRPLVALGGGRYLIPFRDMFFHKISRGVYPTLMKLARASGDAAAERRVIDRRKDATEDFTRDRLTRACGPDARSLDDRRYGGKEAGDAVVFERGARVLILAEVKSGQRERHRRTWGGTTELFGPESDLAVALGQLARTVADALSPETSRYPISRLTGDPADVLVRRSYTIVPLVVTDEPFAHNRFLRAVVDREAAKRGLRADPLFTTPVGIVSFRDVDLLATPCIAGLGVARLLVEWLRDPVANSVSLREFLRRRGVDWDRVRAERNYKIVPPGVDAVLWDRPPRAAG